MEIIGTLKYTVSDNNYEINIPYSVKISGDFTKEIKFELTLSADGLDDNAGGVISYLQLGALGVSLTKENTTRPPYLDIWGGPNDDTVIILRKYPTSSNEHQTYTIERTLIITQDFLKQTVNFNIMTSASLYVKLNDSPSWVFPDISIQLTNVGRNGYFVKYDPNYGDYATITATGLPKDSEQIIANYTYTIPKTDIERKEYIFSHWNTKKDNSGTSYYPGDSLTSNQAQTITLYAIWSQAQYYAASYKEEETEEGIQRIYNFKPCNIYVYRNGQYRLCEIHSYDASEQKYK